MAVPQTPLESWRARHQPRGGPEWSRGGSVGPLRYLRVPPRPPDVLDVPDLKPSRTLRSRTGRDRRHAPSRAQASPWATSTSSRRAPRGAAPSARRSSRRSARPPRAPIRAGHVTSSGAVVCSQVIQIPTAVWRAFCAENPDALLLYIRLAIGAPPLPTLTAPGLPARRARA